MITEYLKGKWRRRESFSAKAGKNLMGVEALWSLSFLLCFLSLLCVWQHSSSPGRHISYSMPDPLTIWHCKRVACFCCWLWRTLAQPYKGGWMLLRRRGGGCLLNRHHLCFQSESFLDLYNTFKQHTSKAWSEQSISSITHHKEMRSKGI